MRLVAGCLSQCGKEAVSDSRPLFHGLCLLRCTDSHGTCKAYNRWGACAPGEAMLSELPAGAPGQLFPCLEQGRLGWARVLALPDGGRLETIWDLMTFWPQEDACPGRSPR